MIELRPIKLTGLWEEGYALDYHVASSIYLGEDQDGRSLFDTIRTPIGQILYEFKYGQNFSKIDDLANLINPFLQQWNVVEKVELIIPTPSSKRYRLFQPVDEICIKISELINRPVALHFIEKTDQRQSKNLDRAQKRTIEGTIRAKKFFKKKTSILLVDDLYDSGKTLEESANILKKDPNVNNIYVLTMTKTKG